MLASIAYAAETVAEIAPQAAPVVVTVADAWSQLVSTIVIGIVGIMTAILPYAVILARSWVKAKIDKIKNDELRAAADYAMLRLDRIVMNTVKEIEQVKSTADKGPLTKDQKKQLLTVAYNRVKAQVHDDVIQAVNQVVKDSDRYIITKIEASVGDLKQASTR